MSRVPNRKQLLLIPVLACVMLLCVYIGYRAASQPQQQQEQQQQEQQQQEQQQPQDEENNDSGLKIYYAQEGVIAVEDKEQLQQAVDEMLDKAQEGQMALEFKNVAYSKDGVNFDIYLANSLSNSYDMFIAIYGDNALTDQLFLSGLLRPGTAFGTITLDHALEPGTHTVYVVHTQVEEDLETIHAQVIITMEFVVAE